MPGRTPFRAFRLGHGQATWFQYPATASYEDPDTPEPITAFSVRLVFPVTVTAVAELFPARYTDAAAVDVLEEIAARTRACARVVE